MLFSVLLSKRYCDRFISDTLIFPFSSFRPLPFCPSVELLKESPSPALRSCSALAQKYHALARELFNAAFVSCWTDLYDQYQVWSVNSCFGCFQHDELQMGHCLGFHANIDSFSLSVKQLILISFLLGAHLCSAFSMWISVFSHCFVPPYHLQPLTHPPPHNRTTWFARWRPPSSRRTFRPRCCRRC